MIPLQKDNQEEGVCPICQESLKEAVSTNCGHLFCRVCLTQHVEKASVSGVFCCPLCRKPCSEEVLGTGYICPNHQKRVCRFCEESRLLLCVECLVSPEHMSHHELTIENALSHYKERLNRRSRKLRKDIAELQRLKAQQEKKLQALQFQVDHENHRLEAGLESQHQTREQLDALPQQWLGQLEHMPAEVARILDISRAVTQLSSLVIDLERTAKELDTNTLKNAGDLLNRSAPQKLEVIYPQLEKGVSELLLQPPSEALTCSSLGHLTSGSPQPPLSPSSNLSRPPLGLPSASSGLPAPEHVTISSCLQSSPDA
ncbi:E3 ubiquitin ligase TRIM40 isoform X1 [Hylobates moloch]|uniref:E3 ubiquitin ligase TRIM40 isoform X1 n=1 Tax=Hylobates moloch TaxID=81572 RepID=UPI001363741F|nr:E3 ubiquitin ligase TRIM40 isoform X1 [Hylobates moloch]XP_058288125.1 E3 ubiquitin ligase TRIM40 isoform X1 [Hylobates moloch]